MWGSIAMRFKPLFTENNLWAVGGVLSLLAMLAGVVALWRCVIFWNC